MTKKSFAVILVLSILTTFVATFIEVVLSGNIIAGQSGFPLKFDSSSLFGGSSTNYPMLFLDVAFWLIVIWGIWKILPKLFNRK